jgi:ATP adenylyltransferase
VKRLWSPWRSRYIDSFSKKVASRKCIFCGVKNEGDDADRLIVWKGEECYIIMNLFPYNSGHLMVVPYRHRAALHDLTDDECLELMNGTKLAMKLLERVSHPDGFNVGANFGRSSGAGIEGHVHIHVVPRWQGDTNFLPVVSDTKIISQDIQDTYKKLKNAVRRITTGRARS